MVHGGCLWIVCWFGFSKRVRARQDVKLAKLGVMGAYSIKCEVLWSFVAC